MTNFTKNLLVAAAALAVAAGAASAQPLQADIPFAFEVNGNVLSAGTYRVDHISNLGHVYRFMGGQESAIVLAASEHDAQKAWKAAGNGKLAFECGPNRCVLVELWDGTGRPATSFYRPKTVDMGTRIAIVNMRREPKGD